MERDRCNAPRWLLKTIADGHEFHFENGPPLFSGVIETNLPSPQHAEVMMAEISEMLSKQAIRIVPEGQRESGYYARYFLVPKKQGGMRPILDLSNFNLWVKKEEFQMLTFQMIKQAIRPQDWCCTLDLKDAYFHIPIAERHRKYLRFSFQNTTYEYNVLPFGYKLAPRTFSVCLRAALEPLRREGIRVRAYLDDLILMAASEELAMDHTMKLVSHMSSLGLVLNWSKSNPWPSHQVTYVGLALDTMEMKATLSPDRCVSLRQALSLVRAGQWAQVHAVRRLLGIMSSAHQVVPLGLLHMRQLQRWFNRVNKESVLRRHHCIQVPHSVGGDLAHWQNQTIIDRGVSLVVPSERLTVFTDASLLGWGGVCGQESIGGLWSDQEKLRHINLLELHTVTLVLKHFAHIVQRRHVLIRSDNVTTVRHINHQGGTASAGLLALSTELMKWVDANLLSIEALHIKGKLNVAADTMSRGGPHPDNWCIHPLISQMIWDRFGTAKVDLFAAKENAKCDLWFSLSPAEKPPLGTDALGQTRWQASLLYAFPPVRLISATLNRIRRERASVIMVAPDSPGAVWYPDLIELATTAPWRVPDRSDALIQAGGHLTSAPVISGHPLAVWKLKG